MNESPIGVIDSGIGGLSILREIVRQTNKILVLEKLFSEYNEINRVLLTVEKKHKYEF